MPDFDYYFLVNKIEKYWILLHFTTRKIILDGTLITAPKSNNKDNPETSGYSDTIKDSGFNTLAARNEDGVLAYISGTYSGNHHDYSILKGNTIDLGLYSMAGGPNTSLDLMQKTLAYADRGFIGTEKTIQVLPHVYHTAVKTKKKLQGDKNGLQD